MAEMGAVVVPFRADIEKALKAIDTFAKRAKAGGAEAADGFGTAENAANDLGGELRRTGTRSERAGGLLRRLGIFGRRTGRDLRSTEDAADDAGDEIAELGSKSVTSGTSMRTLNNRLRSFGGVATKGAAAAGAFGAALGTATVAAINSAAEIGDIADRTGASAEGLQVLQRQAKRFGLDTEIVNDAMQDLNEKLGEAANLGTGEAAEALSILATSQEDLNRILSGSTDEIFVKLIERLGEIDGTARKSALAAQLFGGEAGPKLVALIEAGVTGIEELEAAMRDAGTLMSEEMVDDAQEARTALNTLFGVIKTEGTATLAAFAPQIEEATGKINEFVKAFSSMLREQAKIAQGDFDVELEVVQRRIRETEERLAKSRAQGDEPLPGIIGLPLSGAIGALVPSARREKQNALERDLEILRKRQAELQVLALKEDAFADITNDRLETEKKITEEREKQGALGGNPQINRDELIRTFEPKPGTINPITGEVAGPQSGKPSASTAPSTDAAAAGSGSFFGFDFRAFADQLREETAGFMDAAYDADQLYRLNRDVFSRSFADGVQSAMSGDLRGFLQNQLGNAFSNAMRRAGDALFDIVSTAFAGIGGGGGGGLGGLIGGLFQPRGLATGGPVSAGTPYIVGERGQELFVPNVGGRIINARETAGMLGGGSKTNVTVINNAPGTVATPRQRGNDTEVIIETVAQAIARGGNPIANAMERTYSSARRGF